MVNVGMPQDIELLRRGKPAETVYTTPYWHELAFDGAHKAKRLQDPAHSPHIHQAPLGLNRDGLFPQAGWEG
jgi:hypothetical protein